MPSDEEMALLLPISTTCPYVHLFSSGAKTLAKQATGQDHTLFSVWKEKPARSNYHMALLTFAPLSLNHILSNPLQIAKRTPEQTCVMKTSQPMQNLFMNNLKSPFKNNHKNPFENDLNVRIDFQPDSNRTSPTFRSI